MGSRTLNRAKTFIDLLWSIDEENTPSLYEEDIQISTVRAEEMDLLNMICSNEAIFVCEKMVPKCEVETSNCSEISDAAEAAEEQHTSIHRPDPEPLSVHTARQLVSFYVLAQSPSIGVMRERVLGPLWVRCDRGDPAGTTWLGAETLCTGTKVTGTKLYSITSKAATSDKKSLMSLDEVKQLHRATHQPPTMQIKGSARYKLFGSTVVENTVIEAHSSISVDFSWTDVCSLLETPPMSSTATLNIQVSVGDMRSPMFDVLRELEFLQILADGLRTGEIDWLEPMETASAVEETKAHLEELQNASKTPDHAVKPPQTQNPKSEDETPSFTSALERGDLDFIEQLWVRLRKTVTSYQDIGSCLKLVIDALRYGNIKPWVHRDSSSSLSKLILQSYHQKIDKVDLSGLAPVQMLLEMGLDKIRKDYINYLIGEELTTLNHLQFYLSSEVELQEQVLRLRKLRHLLETVVTCSTFLGLPYHRLFLLTQSCLQFYKTHPYDESHSFSLPLKPATISHFYQTEHPVLWGVEVSSRHGAREVRTLLQLSDRPLDHTIFDSDLESLSPEEPLFFSSLICCSFLSFT